MENETEVIVVPAEASAAAIQETVAEAVAEVHEEVNENAKLDRILEVMNARFDGVERSLAEVISRQSEGLTIDHATQAAVEDLTEAVDDVVTVAVDEVQTAEEIAENIAQIDNDIDVDGAVVEEVLDTNSVIDAIAPQVKQEKRRVRFG